MFDEWTHGKEEGIYPKLPPGALLFISRGRFLVSTSYP